MAPEHNADGSSGQSQSSAPRRMTMGDLSLVVVALGNFEIGTSPGICITLFGGPTLSTSAILDEFEKQRRSDGSEASTVTQALIGYLSQTKTSLKIATAVDPGETHPQLSADELVRRANDFSQDLEPLDWRNVFIERLQSQLQDTDDSHSGASYKQEFEAMLQSSKGAQFIKNTTGAVRVEASP